jgi:copper chaperone NosL
MKSKWHIPVFVFAVILLSIAGTIALAQSNSDIEEHRDCRYCNMDRKAYGFSRMLVQYEDGTVVGVCSLHCALVDLDANPGRKVKALLVADRSNRNLLDVEKAVWVMGGKKSGVMTKRAKWAFESKEGAEAFIAKYEGKIVSWAEILAAAREDLAHEVR